MKKIVVCLLSVFMAVNVFSQEKTTVYCEMVGSGLFKLRISVDYGDRSMWQGRTVITDENGNVEKFNSMIDALNYMNTKGCEFVNAYAIGNAQNGYVYHYLLKKEIDVKLETPQE